MDEGTRRLNELACALLDVLPEDGVPESYVHVAAEQAGILNPGGALNLLVCGGLLAISDTHRIVPGREWARVKAQYEQWKQEKGARDGRRSGS